MKRIFHSWIYSVISMIYRRHWFELFLFACFTYLVCTLNSCLRWSCVDHRKSSPADMEKKCDKDINTFSTFPFASQKHRVTSWRRRWQCREWAHETMNSIVWLFTKYFAFHSLYIFFPFRMTQSRSLCDDKCTRQKVVNMQVEFHSYSRSSNETSLS